MGAREFYGGINDQQRPELADSGLAALDQAVRVSGP